MSIKDYHNKKFEFNGSTKDIKEIEQIYRKLFIDVKVKSIIYSFEVEYDGNDILGADDRLFY